MVVVAARKAEFEKRLHQTRGTICSFLVEKEQAEDDIDMIYFKEEKLVMMVGASNQMRVFLGRSTNRSCSNKAHCVD